MQCRANNPFSQQDATLKGGYEQTSTVQQDMKFKPAIKSKNPRMQGRNITGPKPPQDVDRVGRSFVRFTFTKHHSKPVPHAVAIVC